MARKPRTGLYLPGRIGNYASVPSSALLNGSGGQTIILRVAFNEWPVRSSSTLIGKYSTSGNQRMWRIDVATSGAFALIVSVDGTAASSAASSAGALSVFKAGVPVYLRCQRVQSTGSTQFSYSFDGVSYTNLGSPTSTSSGPLFSTSTAPLTMGSFDIGVQQNPYVTLYSAYVRYGTTDVLNVDFTKQSAGATSFTESAAGATVTLNQSGTLPASIVSRGATSGRVATSSRTRLSSYRALIMADSPLAYFRFGESSGTIAADETGNITAATYTKAGSASLPTLGVTGLIANSTNTAMSLNGGTVGSSDISTIILGSTPNLQLNNIDVEFWVKTSDTIANYRTILARTGQYLYVGVNTGKLTLYDFGVPAQRDTGIFIADGNKHHVAVLFRSGVAGGTDVYLDGRKVFSTTVTWPGGVTNLFFGQNAGNQGFTGTLDEAAFYTGGTLTAAKIWRRYQAGFARAAA